ncbi:MAG: Rrf2 family transcriptional regulator [Calditrichia bacterium]|nr:Rrf2 family transcriptional regulator [Calditrichia bacterium]
MRLYKTSEYALRVLIYMANNNEDRYSVNKLHKTLNIPYKYLGRLMPRLAEAGIISATKGKSGGYCFARPLNKIFLNEIIDVVEGWENYKKCILGFEKCGDEHPCPLHEQWAPIKIQILEMFQTVTLSDTIKKELIKI